MSDKYISVEAFTAAAMERYCKECERRKGKKNGKHTTLYEIGDAPCRSCGIMDMIEDVEAFPPADVRPVVRGEWERPKGSTPRSWIFVCSKCGDRAYFPVPKYFPKGCGYSFCPNCGADMREANDG